MSSHPIAKKLYVGSCAVLTSFLWCVVNVAIIRLKSLVVVTTRTANEHCGIWTVIIKVISVC